METTPESPDTAAPNRSPAVGWQFPLLLAVLLLGIILWGQRPTVEQPATTSANGPPSPIPTGDVVRLEIDFGNGARRTFDALPYRPDMTVADVMSAAREFRPGITFTQVGEGARGLLTGLEGVKNEGASGRNWRYEVAGSPGTRSFCVVPVAAGELVRWTFAGDDANR